MPNLDRDRTMSSPSDEIDPREAAVFLVSHKEQQSRSRMLAYSQVARSVGASSSWLRKFVSDNDGAREPRWSVGEKIIQQYRSVCARIEADAIARNQRAQQYKGAINAILECNQTMGESVSGRAEMAARMAQGEGGEG